MSDEAVRGGFPQTQNWQAPGLRSPGGASEYGDMIASLRSFLDAVAAAAPDAGTVASLAEDLSGWTSRLAGFAAPEHAQIFAKHLDLPGRGQTMAPNFVVNGGDISSVHGTVRFGRYFLGGGGAVHGGAVPLMFDEVLGRLANSGGRPPSRTAYLNTDFRSITPIDADLAVRGWFVSEQGRKRVLRATIKHGDTVCAAAEGLFVSLLPNQP